MGPKDPGMAPRQARPLSRGGESRRIRHAGMGPEDPGMAPREARLLPWRGVDVSGMLGWGPRTQGWLPRGPSTPVAGSRRIRRQRYFGSIMAQYYLKSGSRMAQYYFKNGSILSQEWFKNGSAPLGSLGSASIVGYSLSIFCVFGF